jgi:signal transduction histidine kinase
MEALTGPTPALQEQFTKALETHLTQGGEAPLLSAYELGRTALNERLGVFDVATLRREARRVCCSVRDDGVGFDPGTAGRSTVKGVGLIGIRERLAPLGGALSIDAAPGRGTELRVAIPVL